MKIWTLPKIAPLTLSFSAVDRQVDRLKVHASTEFDIKISLIHFFCNTPWIFFSLIENFFWSLKILNPYYCRRNKNHNNITDRRSPTQFTACLFLPSIISVYCTNCPTDVGLSPNLMNLSRVLNPPTTGF